MFRSLSFVVALALPLSASAADGSLKVSFRLEGPAPMPAPVAVGPVAFCGPKGLVDESLKVSVDGSIQNIVMWMYVAPMKKAPESAAAVAALAKEVKVDNKDCRFEPRVTLLHTSQTLVLGNPDPIGHAVKADTFANPAFVDLIPAGGFVRRNLAKNESRPMPLSCPIHPWMGGWILIRDNPYFGVSNAKGELTIANIPEGTHTFVIWHEKAGFVIKGNQNGKAHDWKLGRIEVKIAGETDLGEFTIPLGVLDKTKK